MMRKTILRFGGILALNALIGVVLAVSFVATVRYIVESKAAAPEPAIIVCDRVQGQSLVRVVPPLRISSEQFEIARRLCEEQP